MGFSIGGALKGAIGGFVGSGGNPWGAVAGGAAGGFAGGEEDQANNAALAGLDDQYQYLEMVRKENVERGRPYLEAGYNALRSMQGMTGQKLTQLPGESDRKFERAQDRPFNWKKDPGYQFRKAEGNQAIDRRQAAGGSFLSGESIKAATRYNQDFASNEFSNVFNRLSTIAGFGPASYQNSNQQFTTSQAGNSISDYGFQRASGYTNDANNTSDLVNGLFKIGGSIFGGGGGGGNGTLNSMGIDIGLGKDW